MEQQINIVDRSEMLKKLNKNLKIDRESTAVITIDMHRGHLDPEVATMPCTEEICKDVIKHTSELLNFSRDIGLPIIHVVMVNRIKDGLALEGRNVKFWKALGEIQQSLSYGKPSQVNKHNLIGSVQTEVIPELYKETDYIIDSKRRLSAFYGTDLEILLRTLGIKTTILAGINTNTCVLCSTFEAFNRDYYPVVISECVNSMYGQDLHIFGLQNIARCLGWVLNLEEFKSKMS